MGKEEKSEKGLQKAAASPVRALSPFEEMDRWFDGFFPRGWPRPARWDWPALEGPAPFEGKTPKVDVIERDDEVVVRAELPGVKKDDIEISVTENRVTVKGSTSYESREEKGSYHRMEMSRGIYQRSMSLPAQVDGDRARASFRDGVLELTLPKLEKARRKAIRID